MGKFAPSQFLDLSEDERLARPSFESFQDGVSFGSDDLGVSEPQERTARYETVFIPDNRRVLSALDIRLFVHSLEFGAIARSELHAARLFDGEDQRVSVFEPAYQVVAIDSLAATAQFAEAFPSASAAFAAAATASEPLTVVGVHEVAS